jgi:amidophosphoribosyltransferase
MLDGAREHCGVVAVASVSGAYNYLIPALRAVQHRGQESAGVAVFDGRKTACHKDLGLAESVFRNKSEAELPGHRGIGHTYYSIQLSKPENAQPHIISTAAGDIAIAHNGIIVNSDPLMDEMKRKGHAYLTGTEEETMAYLLSDELLKSGNVVRAIRTMMKRISGSYALSIMIGGSVFAVRDPWGIKPLCLGKLRDGYIAASESVAVDVCDGELVRDVAPGEVVELRSDGYESYPLMTKQSHAHCFFEYVYFARTDAIIDGHCVYETRKRIGWRLAKEQPVRADIIVPIPDSGRAHAFGFSLGSKIPLAEGLIKNRYIDRTFIMPDQSKREMNVREKVNPIKSVIRGNRVVIVDDSIVRGTTMRKIVRMLRVAGAKEVHVRIGSPPIITPCYLGIDMTTRGQLLASGKEVSKICREITADSLGYISINGLVEALEIPRNDLCLGCVTGEYPLEIPGEKQRYHPRLYEFGKKGGKTGEIGKPKTAKKGKKSGKGQWF